MGMKPRMRAGKLSLGEKMVWAAAFVKHLDLSNPPKHCLYPTDESHEAWGEWECDQAIAAVDGAAGFVRHLRECSDGVVAAFGKDSDAYRMLMEILS